MRLLGGECPGSNDLFTWLEGLGLIAGQLRRCSRKDGKKKKLGLFPPTAMVRKAGTLVGAKKGPVFLVVTKKENLSRNRTGG